MGAENGYIGIVKGVDPKISGSRGGQPKYYAGIARKKEFLDLFDNMAGDLDATLGPLGIPKQTYYTWRSRDKRFMSQCEAIRSKHMGEDTPKGDWPTGFAGFRKEFFGHDSAWFHLEVVHALETAEPGTVTLVLFPPEHGKTTLLEDWINYKLALDSAFRITVGSERQDHSKKVLRRVRHRMEDQGSAPLYVTRWGPFAPRGKHGAQQPWGAEYFDVYKKGKSDERDYSAQALGITAGIAGTRCDLLLADDMQSRKTLNRTELYLEMFRQDWLTRPGPKGRTVMLGTRVGEGDIYQTLIEETEVIDRLILLPAINDDGEYLWPERYSPAEYEGMRRKAGEEAWERNYMQKSSPPGEATFNDASIDPCKNPMRSVLHDARGSGALFVTIDPSIGGKNCTTALHATPTGLRILDQRVDSGLTTNEQILNIAEEYGIRYGKYIPWTDLIIEQMGFQKGLIEDPRLQEMVKHYGFACRGHETGWNKYDENIGIPSMAMSFRRQEIDIPWAEDDVTRRHMQALIAELKTWRPWKRGTKLRQDRVMGLWFGWLTWRTRKNALVTDTSQFRFKGSTLKPMPVVVRGQTV